MMLRMIDTDKGAAMKAELSAWKFIKNNKKRVGAMVVALMMVFTAMYLIAMLLNASIESFEPIVFTLPKKIAYLSLSLESYGIDPDNYTDTESLQAAYDEKRNELIEKLKGVDGITDVYYTQVIMCTYQAVFGMIGYEIPLLEPEEIPGFLDHLNARLTAGRMPSGAGEVLVDETVMKNNGKEIGDHFNPNAYNETFTIVGIISSPTMMGVGTPNGYTNSGWAIAVEKDESIYDMRAVLKQLGINASDTDKVTDEVDYKKYYDEEVKGVLDKVIDVMYLAAMLFLAFTVLIAYIAYIRNRINEYCLYMSIGYSRSAIYGMIMREMLFIFLSGSLIGMVLGLCGGWIIFKLLIEAKGLYCRIFMPEVIFKIAAAYVMIMGILQIPVILGINKVITIDAIED